MAIDWDKIVEIVNAEMRKIYSEKVIDHATNPRNAGRIDDDNGFANITGPCGDTMQIWLKVQDGHIDEAAFLTDGCGTTIAAGSMITELAKGKSIKEALKIGQQEVLDALEGLPEESQHCALLASNTLKEAIKDHLNLKNEPWKRQYRKP